VAWFYHLVTAKVKSKARSARASPIIKEQKNIRQFSTRVNKSQKAKKMRLTQPAEDKLSRFRRVLFNTFN